MALTALETGVVRTPSEMQIANPETQPSRVVINEYNPSDPNNWFIHQVAKTFQEDSSYSVWREKTEDGNIKLTANEKASLAYFDFNNRPLIQALSQSSDKREVSYINGSSEEQCITIQKDLDQIAAKTNNRSSHLQGRILATYAQTAINRFEDERNERLDTDDFSIGEHTHTRSEIEKFLRSQKMNGFTPFGSGSIDREDIEGLLGEELESMKRERNDQLTPSSGDIYVAAD